jgi:hypothetical protein
MALWSDLKIKLIETGDETGTWGITTNENFNNVIEQAITGSATVTFVDADVTLALIDSTDLQDARALRLNLTGVVTATRTLFVPNIQKFYLINNDLTEAITVQNTVGAGDALTIPAGRSTLVFNDATDIINPNTYFAGAILSDAAVILGGAINATPIGGISASTGAFTTLGASENTTIGTTGANTLTINATPTFNVPVPVASGGTNSTNATDARTALSAAKLGANSDITSLTGLTTPLSAAQGGTGLTTFTAGTTYVAPATATTFTATQTFTGSTTAISAVFQDVAEVITISATAATGTINYDVTTQSVLYYTSNALANWTVNIRGNGTTSLNTLMSTGQSVTIVFLVTQGSTAYYNNVLTIDGSSVTPKWQGGIAPTAGNASSVDAYSYTIVKTGSATFTVLASQVQFK